MSCKSARCLTSICLAYKETLLVIFTLRHGRQLHQWQPLMEKVIETPLTESISISFPWMGWYSMIHLHLAYFPTIIKVLRDVLQLFLRIVFEDFRIRSCSIANRVHLNVILRYRPGFWQLIKMAWIQYLAILFIFLFLFDRVKRFVFENQVVTTVPMKIEKEHLDW